MTKGAGQGRKILWAALLLALCIGMVSAVPPLPQEFWGSIRIDGVPAPAGTDVVAVMYGTERGRVTTPAAGILGASGTFDRRLVVSATEEDFSGPASPEVTVGLATCPLEVRIPYQQGVSQSRSLDLRAPKAIPAAGQLPHDPDSDWVYEELNGNGVMDYDDAVVLFWNVNWISANEPVPCFDVNGNGIMDYDDAVTLFWEI